MRIQNQGFDHVEFAVQDIVRHGETYRRMGFEKVGERQLRGTKSSLWAQGLIRILLTQPDGAQGENQESIRFLRKHAEGICTLAVDVDDAAEAFKETTKRGARPAREPETFTSPVGSLTVSEIWTPADVRYRFVTRKSAAGVPSGPGLFDEGLVAARLESPSPLGLRQIDHLTNNVGMGEMKSWVEWYKQVFGFIVSRTFNIRTARTGLISDVVESSDHRIKVPINEGTEKTSQVQEFVDRMKGPGVQHLALLTTGIMDTLRSLRREGYKFLQVPHTYYEVVPTRVPGVTENLGELEDLGILLDGEGKGYLMQIFSEEIVGPFFFEFIQRKGNDGFGEGNFRALFEAIERDQVKRGVLKV